MTSCMFPLGAQCYWIQVGFESNPAPARSRSTRLQPACRSWAEMQGLDPRKAKSCSRTRGWLAVAVQRGTGRGAVPHPLAIATWWYGSAIWNGMVTWTVYEYERKGDEPAAGWGWS